MDPIQIFGLIIIVGFPVAYLFLRILFGKSFLFTISYLTVLMMCLNGFLLFFTGIKGVRHLSWSVPSTMLISLIIYQIINRIRKPLEKVTYQIKELSEGTLKVDLQVSKSIDEIGALNNSLYNLVVGIRKIATAITNSASNLATASQQANLASDQVSKAAYEQTRSIDDIANTVGNISIKIRNSEEDSSLANKNLTDVSGKSRILLESNQLLTEKINMLHNIASQTDVPAQITDLARSVLKLTQDANDSIRNSIAGIENTSKLLQRISVSCMEQYSRICQVSYALDQLNERAQQNAILSLELTASAEVLAGEAEQMKKSISFFKVE